MEPTSIDPIDIAIQIKNKSVKRVCRKCGKELGDEDYDITCKEHVTKWPE